MSVSAAEIFEKSIAIKQSLMEDEGFLSTLESLSRKAAQVISRGGKLLVCGNGGSASDSMHLVGEVVGRFQCERPGWPAIALCADPTTMTAIANDYTFDRVFSRQVEAYANPEDLFIGISTSGNSANVIQAARAAQSKGCATAALLGGDGGQLKDIVEFALLVPSDVTARVQESHIVCIHIMCQIIEEELA